MKLMSIIVLVAVVTFFSGVAAAQPGEVMIKNQQFIPHDVTIVKGETVTWNNMDQVDHTVKFADSESSVLKPGGKYSKMFNKEGTFTYGCGIHPNMMGRVIVTSGMTTAW